MNPPRTSATAAAVASHRRVVIRGNRMAEAPSARMSGSTLNHPLRIRRGTVRLRGKPRAEGDPLVSIPLSCVVLGDSPVRLSLLDRDAFRLRNHPVPSWTGEASPGERFEFHVERLCPGPAPCPV